MISIYFTIDSYIDHPAYYSLSHKNKFIHSIETWTDRYLSRVDKYKRKSLKRCNLIEYQYNFYSHILARKFMEYLDSCQPVTQMYVDGTFEVEYFIEKEKTLIHRICDFFRNIKIFRRKKIVKI